jgi:glycine cleavage system transcriptional repressor
MEYLSIVSLGANNPQILSTITDLITKFECKIIRSRMTVLGADNSTACIVCGNWSAIAKLETALQNFEASIETTFIVKRTQYKQAQTALPYNVQVIGIDDSSIIHEIVTFFAQQEIAIEDCFLETGEAHNTQTAIFNLNMVINLPTEKNIVAIREQFENLCNDINVDGILEPERHF